VRAAGSAPLVSLAGLRLASGRAYSAVLLGSRGQRLRWVTVTDRGAPLTRRGARGTGASPGTVIVDRGDSLWSIARARLGPSASNEAVYREVLAIWAINARRIGTGDPNLIFPGQRIVLPD
jgi:nucleoid-associated protein YgaU